MLSKGEDFPLVYPALLCVSGNRFHTCNPWRANTGARPPPPSDWGKGAMGRAYTPCAHALSASRRCASRWKRFVPDLLRCLQSVSKRCTFLAEKNVGRDPAPSFVPFQVSRDFPVMRALFFLFKTQTPFLL